MACLHLTAPDETQGLQALINDINDVLYPPPDASNFYDYDEEEDAPNRINDMDIIDEDKGDQKKLIELKEPFKSQDKNVKDFKVIPDANEMAEQRTLCIQRLYNHEDEFSINSDKILTNKWKLFVGPPNKTCWICSKSHYTLFFHKLPRSAVHNGDVTL